MNKSSIGYLINCYIWFVDTIARGPVTRTEIDNKWARSSVNDNKTGYIPESTFHRWRNAVQEVFDIDIKCNSSGEYYIEEAKDIRNANLRTRMLNLMSVNNLLRDGKDLRNLILFEPVSSGEKFLTQILEALRDKCAIHITYQGFGKPQPATFIVEPYCLKMFKQRWYMLAYSPDIDEIRVYALDRIHAVEPTKQKYEIPDSCDAESYFRDSYGVTVLDDEPEHVTISISEKQAPYLRTLPLHPSQKETEPHDGYPAFSYYLIPNEEFCRELRAYGSNVEVLSPQWLRDEFAKDASLQNKMYNTDHE